jgi:two-component system, OmpR family, sensor histidine kinase VicK
MLQFLIIGGGLLGALVVVLAATTFVSEHPKKPKQPKSPQPTKQEKHKKNNHDAALGSDIILEAIEDGVVLVGMDKTIRSFNRGASKITGWPVEEAIGLDYHLVFKFIDDKGIEYKEEQRPFTRVFATQTVVRDSQATIISRSNKRVAVHISVSPLFDEVHAMTGAAAIFRDVSEERGEERQRAEFISTASHEMRTPVAAIEGYLALAMNERVSKIDAKARDYLQKAHASTQHLGQLFQDLLTSAKAEDGRLSSHPKVVELGEFLERLTEDLRFAAEKKGLGIEYVIGTTGDTIDASSSNNKAVRPLYYTYADPDRLREVITNLFDNAVKYTDSGKVSLGLTGDQSIVQFYVRDTGPGIPPEDVSHLFQKFYRVDNSVTRTIGGTGLGLFISRKIIELYSGRIWVESTVGQGSTFFVNLPRIDNAKARALELQAAAQPTPLPEVTSITD